MGTDRDYELRSDIDASPTENWVEPIGTEAFDYNTGSPTDMVH